MRLRAFVDSDASAVNALIHRTIDQCYPCAYPPRAVSFFKQHHSVDAILSRASVGSLIVVEDDAGLVATGARMGCEIGGVFVAPEKQGSGLGALVMDELESAARAAGDLVVSLDVSLPSRGFYERRGYTVIADCSIDVGDGQELHYWEARKLLDTEA